MTAKVELAPGSIGRSLEDLIPATAPARPRCLGVLDGTLAGHAWADDPLNPTWVIVIEISDGTVYAGGALTADLIVNVLAGVTTASGDLIFGFDGPDDPVRAHVPPDPYYVGEAIDFTDRVPPPDDAATPTLEAGCELVRIGPELLPLTEWYDDTLVAFGSVERWAELAVGYAVMRGDEMLADGIAGPRIRGSLEMGVATRERARGRGFGTIVSRAVARACEATGERVWWNASATNEPSLAIARRLGFRTERRYELVAYRTDRLR